MQGVLSATLAPAARVSGQVTQQRKRDGRHRENRETPGDAYEVENESSKKAFRKWPQHPRKSVPACNLKDVSPSQYHVMASSGFGDFVG